MYVLRDFSMQLSLGLYSFNILEECDYYFFSLFPFHSFSPLRTRSSLFISVFFPFLSLYHATTIFSQTCTKSICLGYKYTRYCKQNTFQFDKVPTFIMQGGWLVAFGGAVVLKALYGAWWVVIYEALIVIGTLMVFMSNRMQHYRYSVSNLFSYTLTHI